MALPILLGILVRVGLMDNGEMVCKTGRFGNWELHERILWKWDLRKRLKESSLKERSTSVHPVVMKTGFTYRFDGNRRAQTARFT